MGEEKIEEKITGQVSEADRSASEKKKTRREKSKERKAKKAMAKNAAAGKGENVGNDENETSYSKVKVTRTGFIKLLQHVFITAAAVCLFVVAVGSCVSVPTYNGSVSTYMLSKSDENRKYEDSVLFNTILGNELPNVVNLIKIETQIETDGHYDSSKIIDLKDIVYPDGDSMRLSPEIDAQYYLGDLLKWSKYGFESSEYTYSELSAAGKILAVNETDGNPALALNGDDYDYDTFSMITNRYKSVDGRTLEEIAGNWSEYNELTELLVKASDSLYEEYAEYLKLSDYYDGNATNIRYCAINKNGTDTEIYTNADLDSTSVSSVTKAFKAFGKYIIYDSDKMTYDTNTAINESVFNSITEADRSAFSEDGVILFAVDTSMPAKDSIRTGYEGYKNIFPYYSLMICIIIASVMCYILLLVLCTVKEGRVRNTDGSVYIRQNSFDNSSIEIWILLLALIAAAIGVLYMLSTNTEIFDFLKTDELYSRVAVGCLVFMLDLFVLELYYSLVRRIKGRNIWKNSWLHGICEWIAKTSVLIFDNSSTIVRSILPFALIVLFNVCCLILGFEFKRLLPAFILIIVIADIAAAVAVYKQASARKKLIDGLNRIVEGDINFKVSQTDLHGDNKDLAGCVNSIGNSVRNAVEQSMKDEKMKTELVANVSHDIRTPLTSIINYVDLLKRENIPNENAVNYIAVLDEKSQRLKQLIEDLIEASKVSSGNVELEMQKMALSELVNQALGEFEDKFAEKELSCVCRCDKLTNGNIMADGRSLWRVMENLFGNIYKYAMPSTRVFLDMFNVTDNGSSLVVLQIKNMSANPLPANTSDLTERFTRGDQSRTTEGSGLGLSIAKSLTELMGGTFDIASDADLFKVELTFKAV